MSKNKSKLTITRTFTSIAMLTSVCCMAVGSLLPAQAQPTMDISIASFQADATNPTMLVQAKATEQRVALLRNEDFSRGSSFPLLQDHPQAAKPSGLPAIHVGYGQFFPAQNLVFPGASLIEPRSRFYLKISFKF